MVPRRRKLVHHIPPAVYCLLLPGIVCGLVSRPSFFLLQRSTAHSRRVCLERARQSFPHAFHLYMATTSTSVQQNATSTAWDEEDGNWSNDEERPVEDSLGESFMADDEEPSSDSTERVREFKAWSEALDQTLRKLQKKQQSLESEFSKAQNVEDTVRRAQLLVSNLHLFRKGTKAAWVPDWENGGVEIEVTLDPQYESASAEADALFAQARKLKRGSQVVQSLLEETTTAVSTLEDTNLDLQSARISETEIDEGRLGLVKERLVRSSRTTGFMVPDLSTVTDNWGGNRSKSRRYSSPKPELGTPASNVRKLASPGGCSVLVGRNRRGNEYLSLTLARQDDVWMHSRGCPGAHVVIQNRRGGPTPTDDCLQFAADLAVFYSDLRNEARAEVTAAEPKHLLKPRNAPLGAIKIREEWKTFVGRPDQVPEELKVARDKSGQSDEYRQEDKAKHRRRTKQAVEEEKARRRRKNKN